MTMQEAIANPARQLRLELKMAILALMPGDIIATAGGALASTIIRGATNSPFSHAILYRGNGRVVDAVPGEGVNRRTLSATLRGASLAAVFRHKTASAEQCEIAVKWAEKQAGKPYDHLGAGRIGLSPDSRTAPLRYTRAGLVTVLLDESKNLREGAHDASFFCSELIAKAFEVASAPLVDRPAHQVSPGHLLLTNKLVYMGNLREVG